jgi:hypothetical protein
MIKPITASDVQSFVDPLINGVQRATDGIKNILGGGGGGAGGVSSSEVKTATPIVPRAGLIAREETKLNFKIPTIKVLPDLDLTIMEKANKAFNDINEGIGDKAANIDILTNAYQKVGAAMGFGSEQAITLKDNLEKVGVVAFALSEVIATVLAEGFTSFAEGFGQAIAGAASFGDAIKGAAVSAITVLLDVLSNMGKTAIAAGITMDAIKKALNFGSGIGAVLAGGALVALTAAVKSKLASSVPKLASGGVLTGETLFIGGEYPGASTNPEIVTPENLMRKIFREEGGGGGGHLSASLHMDVLRFGLSKDISRVS